ncbi:hypothetical protein ElyMa_006697300 [Elysia marginata]|uniref:Secreted protein n=1 Tax=Elysia marginata TaxID=1093978 RepID=A0AAV4IV73_9GAST|nr:hypothetical protein ElyMa_006697300 [Elysia marginata]
MCGCVWACWSCSLQIVDGARGHKVSDTPDTDHNKSAHQDWSSDVCVVTTIRLDRNQHCKEQRKRRRRRRKKKMKKTKKKKKKKKKKKTKIK